MARNRRREGGMRRGGGRNEGGTANTVPLPPGVRSLASRNHHPGLALDKFAASVTRSFESPKDRSATVQKPTIEQVVRLANEFPRDLYALLARRRQVTLDAVGALQFDAATVGPLTLHLARASSLENAGIALHRTYGFPYLPGTGLKGLARSYAETVWFPAQFRSADGNRSEPAGAEEAERAASAWRDIEAVFGWSPGSDGRKPYKPKTIPRPDDDASAGSIVFHDAWGTVPPRMQTDILNNHHPDYYRNAEPPGDWEDPIPVYFLTIAPEQTFRFALSLRRGADDDEARRTDRRRLALARDWLLGALLALGAGAKTSAGYGRFELRSTSADQTPEQQVAEALRPWRTAEELGLRRSARVDVELASPAFLAGPHQFGPEAAAGCDLRPATLRGLLRWWWRTMHSGFVDARGLSRLESLIFGDTNQSASLQLAVRRVDTASKTDRPQEYNFKDGFRPKDDIKRRLQLADPPNKKTTQGLFYASYGMDDGGRNQPRHRYFRAPGSRWCVELVARPALDPDHPRSEPLLSADLVLEQGLLALWLLCHFGGIGSKSRKGFGSLRWLDPPPPCHDLDGCRTAAADLRAAQGLPSRFNPALAQSPALGLPRLPWPRILEVPVDSPIVWQVLDHVGFAYQRVAQQFAHQEAKLALGLPRKIHGPRKDGPIPRVQRRETWKPPKELRANELRRHASPVIIHVEPAERGHIVRTIAFPSPRLPDLKASQAFLAEFLEQFESYLRRPPAGGATSTGGRGAPAPSDRGGSRPAAPAATPPRGPSRSNPNLPKPGDRVTARLLEEKTKKGGWRAVHVATGIDGPIVNSKETPGDWKAGQEVELIVASANDQQISFRWKG